MLTPKINRAPLVLLGLAGLVLVPAQRSSGQDALGGGNALDANPAQGSRFNPSAAQPNFRERNLLITNDVLGGRGFRGSVGYGAEGDFRGDLGSDELFDFRSGSGWSNINFITYGSTYERLRYGQDVGAVEYRRSAYAASPAEIQQGVLRGESFESGNLVERRLRLDQLSSAATSTTRGAAAAEPLSLGYTRGQEGEMILINASSLQGINALPLQGDFQLLGLTSLDMARLREDIGMGLEVGQPGKPFEISYEDLLRGPLQPGEEEDERPDLTIAQGTRVEPEQMKTRMELREDVPQLGDILQRIAERYAQRGEEPAAEDRTQLMRQLQRDMTSLRDQLRGEQPPAVDAREEPAPPDVAPDVEEEPEEEDQESPESTVPSAEDLGGVLRHGGEVGRLAQGDEGRFNELVTSGEEYLRKGEWFRAERRFTRAMRFSPNHPMATAGLGHAQIGGGLYLSAALTLRNLFTNQPEMIDVRYDEALVPNRPRLSAAVETLRERLEQPNDRALHAFLLAYVGRLMKEREIVEEGLSAMEEAAAGDPLLPLLQEIWLGEGQGEGGEPGEPQPEK